MATAISMNATVTTSKVVLDKDLLSREIRRGKLLYKLLAVFLALSIVPLLVAGFQLIRVGDNYVQKQIIGVKLGIAQKVASNVTSYMEDKKNTLQIVHKSSDFLAMNPRRQSEILGNAMNAYPMFMHMAVIDLNGREISSVNRLGRSSRAELLREEMQALKLIKSLGDYMGPVSRSPEGYPQMTLGVPIERIPGRPIGVLIGVVNLIDLSSLIKDLVIDKSGYVYIVDMQNFQLIAHPYIDTLIATEQSPEIKALKELNKDPKTFAGPRASLGALEFQDGTKNYLATYAAIPRLDWKVFVQQPATEAYEASKQMRNEIFKVLVLVIFITVIIGILISQAIVRRVHTLQTAMEQVGEGNFNVPNVPASNDEFGSLTEKFIWMANSLKDKTLKLVSAQKELQKWNFELEKRVQARTRDLKEAQDQLIAQEKLAALGQMASVVGHELRNPLAVMNNSIYFLKTKLKSPSLLVGEGRDGGTANGETCPPPQSSPTRGEDVLDPKIQKHLNIIETEIVKSNMIIRDILDFSRSRPLNLASHVVDDLVSKAIERIQVPSSAILRKDLTLGTLQIPLDEDEIRQVLVNLMENACQAMVSGGTLTVGTKSHEQHVEIIIADTGCGIPQEHVNKIFAPFFTTKSRGTGLGLAVVKKIVDRHQGTIEVKSKVGEGTAFHIRLLLRGPHA